MTSDKKWGIWGKRVMGVCAWAPSRPVMKLPAGNPASLCSTARLQLLLPHSGGFLVPSPLDLRMSRVAHGEAWHRSFGAGWVQGEAEGKARYGPSTVKTGSSQGKQAPTPPSNSHGCLGPMFLPPRKPEDRL